MELCLKTLAFLVYFLFFFHGHCSSMTEVNTVKLFREVQDVDELPPEPLIEGDVPNELASSLYKTIKRYVCYADLFDNDTNVLLTYGSRSWTFPEQDVNLTLSYPPTEVSENWNSNYVITGINVMLYLDGRETKGYITDGGIMESSVNMSFICSSITMLTYKFWLYGLPDITAFSVTNRTTTLC